MKISGIKKKISRVEIEVEPIEIFEELDKLIRKEFKFQHGFLKQTKNGYGLYETEYSYHNGDPYDSLVDESPSEEIIEYLLLKEKFKKYVYSIKK